MPYNGSGVYSLPAGSLVADGTTIDAADHNTPLLDIEETLSTVALRNGAAPFTGNQVISVNSVGPALRITQVGAGNALLVEDSSNPDSTPTVIDGDGNVIIGGLNPLSKLDVVDVAPVFGDSRAVNTTKNWRPRVPSFAGISTFFTPFFAACESAANILRIGGGTSAAYAATAIRFFTAGNATTTTGTERMVIDSNGNVGIGTGSPGAMLDVQGFTRLGAYGGASQGLTIRNNSVSGSLFGSAFIDFQNENNVAVANIFAEMDLNGRSQMAFDVTAPGARNSDRRRRSAAVAAGATSGSFVVTGIGGFSDTEGRIDIISDADSASRTSYVAIRHRPSAVSGDWYHAFYYNNNLIGSITQSGTTGVAYGTASDYRLKGDVTPMTNRLEAVMALNPVTYTWNADGSAGQGFLAHELQAVIPDAVTGTKDAEDADGNPVYQGVDFSRVVPTLVAAIQEQQAQIAALTIRIEALEAST